MLSLLLSALALAAPPAVRDAWPAWSPDGRQIAFQRSVGRHTYLTVVRVDGSHVRRLARTDDPEDPVRWSPRGRRIAFVRIEGGESTVWTVGADGRGLRRVAAGFAPAWAPDGRTIVYGNGRRLEAVRADGTGRRLLARLQGGAMPAWSPDGSRIAVSAGGPTPHVYLLDPRTRQLRAVAEGWGPTWSSDGTTIGFSRGSVPGTAPADGSSAEPYVFAVSAISLPPEWSPSGNRYVFCHSSPTGRVVIAAGPPGLPVAPLAAGCHPSWSPDGTRIVFERESRLYVMNADGSNVRPLVRADTRPSDQ